MVQGHCHSILTPFVPSWVLGFRYNSPKNSVYISILWLYHNEKLFYCLIILNNIILMIDNDQSTTIKAPEVYKSIPTHSPSRNQRQYQGKKSHLNFDTFDVHVMVNYIEPNFQDIIFTLSTVSLITQKWFSDHLKKWHFMGNTYITGDGIVKPNKVLHLPNASSSIIRRPSLRTAFFNDVHP